MLAKLATGLPAAGDFLYEPKWDGFRAIVFRGDHVYIQSRDQRPFDRYFPELHAVLLRQLPRGCVVDGEIVIATADGLDFDALQMRLHPAASRVAKLAAASPASFVAFDLLAQNGRDLMHLPQSERRELLENVFRSIDPPLFLTPMTRDRARAVSWLKRFEGAGLDGVIAKPADLPLPARPARDDQSQACADSGMRGGGLPVVQGRAECSRLPAARAVRREGRAASRGSRVVVSAGNS
jgi:ATP-dependent DNA ligase